MLKYWRITLALVPLLCVVLGCSKSVENEDLQLAPWAEEEAELIALCLSGELVAPDSLCEQVLSDLATIRAIFGGAFEIVDRISFWPPWMVSYLLMAFHDSTAQLIQAEEYDAWNELNEKYHVTEIKTNAIKYGFVSLSFEGRLNPFRLAEQYEVLPGARYAEPNFWDGDGSNIYARQTDIGLSYLFRYASGDCPAGCIHNEYWYFVCEEGRPAFIGHWIFRHEPEPDWWEEARLNREHYCDE